MAKPHQYLIIAILIPIIMIVIIALSLLIPVQKMMPPYSLLYAIGDNSESFTCLQNMMAKFYPKMNANYYKVTPGSCTKVKLFVYDFNSDSAKPITFEEAKKLRVVDMFSSSANNFNITRNCYVGPDIGLFSMRPSYNDVCLVKDNYVKLLNMNPTSAERLFYFISIGWIVPNKAAAEEGKQ